MPRSNFGTIQYVSKGKYRVWWEAGCKGDGKRNRPSRIVYGTRDDADLFLAVKKINALGCDEFTTYDEFWAAKVGTVKNLAHFSDSLISPPSGAATPPAESRPDSASSPTRSRPRT